jgi:hypothetical protein
MTRRPNSTALEAPEDQEDEEDKPVNQTGFG